LLQYLWRAKSQHQLWSARDLLAKERFAFIFHLFQLFVSFKNQFIKKKFKKSLGPDFIESSELGLQYMRDSFEPKCDLCHLTTKSNKRGEREELLSCKDCSAKGIKYYIFYSIASINVSNPIKSSSKLYGL
jgi:hypothetical protein